MQQLQWTESLSVGVDAIDTQHKKWIEHFNNVALAIDDGHGVAQIVKTLEFLVDYTELHFSTEEKLMVENDYPQYDVHKAKHDELRRTLDDLVQEFQEEGATHVLAAAIDSFLSSWLVKHIQEIDLQMAAFVKEKGIDVG